MREGRGGMYVYTRNIINAHRTTRYLVEVFTPADESLLGEWLAISSRINTWLFSLFRQTKQPSWNPNRPASPKFNLVFACGYIAKRQHRAPNLHAGRRSKLFLDICFCSRTGDCLMWKMTFFFFKLNDDECAQRKQKGSKNATCSKIICLLSIQSGLRRIKAGEKSLKGIY